MKVFIVFNTRSRLNEFIIKLLDDTSVLVSVLLNAPTGTRTHVSWSLVKRKKRKTAINTLICSFPFIATFVFLLFLDDTCPNKYFYSLALTVLNKPYQYLCI